MATPPPNPYNLRGALIRPSGNVAYYYYLMLIDIDLSSVLDGQFVISHPEETGNTLNYHYTGTTSKFVAPIQGKPVATLYLPIYFNQRIDKADLKKDAPQNLFVVLSDSTKKIVLSTGNPYYRHPPIVEVVDNAINDTSLEPYLCSSISFQSASAQTITRFVVVMVNSYQFQAINPLVLTTSQSQTELTLVADFTPPTESHPYNGAIAAVGACENSGQPITNVKCGSVANGPIRVLNWNPNPPPATLPIIIF